MEIKSETILKFCNIWNTVLYENGQKCRISSSATGLWHLRVHQFHNASSLKSPSLFNHLPATAVISLFRRQRVDVSFLSLTPPTMVCRWASTRLVKAECKRASRDDRSGYSPQAPGSRVPSDCLLCLRYTSSSCSCSPHTKERAFPCTLQTFFIIHSIAEQFYTGSRNQLESLTVHEKLAK